MSPLGFTLLVIQYLRDISLIFVASMLLLLCCLWYSQNDLLETPHMVPSVTKVVPVQDDQGVLTADATLMRGDNPGVFCEHVAEEDDTQISFLVVSSTNISIYSERDVKLVSNFHRLKAQSLKTIQTLAQNRRRMTQSGVIRPAAMQIRKVRVKRAQAALNLRQGHPVL